MWVNSTYNWPSTQNPDPNLAKGHSVRSNGNPADGYIYPPVVYLFSHLAGTCHPRRLPADVSRHVLWLRYPGFELSWKVRSTPLRMDGRFDRPDASGHACSRPGPKTALPGTSSGDSADQQSQMSAVRTFRSFSFLVPTSFTGNILVEIFLLATMVDANARTLSERSSCGRVRRTRMARPVKYDP